MPQKEAKVELACRGKVEGIIIPVAGTTNLPPLSCHPAVGMWRNQDEPVPALVRRMRKPRFHFD